MPIQVKADGVWKTVSLPYVKVNDTWRTVKKVQNNVSGSWKTSFEYVTYNLYFYNDGNLVSQTNVRKGDSVTLPHITDTPISVDGNEYESAGWYVTSSGSKPDKTGSVNFSTYAEGAVITPVMDMYLHAVFKNTQTKSGTTWVQGDKVTVQSEHPSSWTGWNRVTESVSVSDAYPGSSYTIKKYSKIPSQYLYWTDYTQFAEGAYSRYPTACYFRFRNYGAAVPDNWTESTYQTGTVPNSKSISASYTCSNNVSLKNSHTTTEANRYLYDKNYNQLRAGLDEYLNYVTYYERVVLKITYYKAVLQPYVTTVVKYFC